MDSIHHFYHIDGLTDLAVIREQCNVRTKDNNKYTRKPSQSIVHMHSFTADCEGSVHEFYSPDDNNDLEDLFWGVMYSLENNA